MENEKKGRRVNRAGGGGWELIEEYVGKRGDNEGGGGKNETLISSKNKYDLMISNKQE